MGPRNRLRERRGRERARGEEELRRARDAVKEVRRELRVEKVRERVVE